MFDVVDNVEKREDLATTPKSSRYWQAELNAANEREKEWREQGDMVVSMFEDERPSNTNEKGNTNKRLNIFWSNTEVLRAALEPQDISPDVRRRFGTQDKVGRQAAIVLERACAYNVDAEEMDIEIAQSVEDMLLPGRGVARVVYEPVVENDEIVEQDVRAEWVHWRDYREGMAKSWKKVPWVAYRHLLTKEQIEQSNFEGDTSLIPMNHTVSATEQKLDEQDKAVLKRGEVWEIWDKNTKQRIWVAIGVPHILRADDDPYQLKGFFPQGKPAYAVKLNKDRVPTPLRHLYKDQLFELDRITTRINRLLEQLRYRGVYDGSEKKLKNFADALDGEFIPVENWAQFAEKGGIAGSIQEQDLTNIIKTVDTLFQQRATLIQAIYEITGISDVIRGSTDPRETKGAQTLKAQFGSMRMQSLQKSVKRLTRDCMRIISEIYSEHFEQERLAEITQVEMSTKAEIEQKIFMLQQQAFMSLANVPIEQHAQAMQQVQQQLEPQIAELREEVTWEKVMDVLRNDDRRSYKLDIETADTAFQDAEADKAARSELYQTVTETMTRSMEAIQASPALLPMMKELTMFTLGAHKIGRSLEESIEDAFEQLQQQLQQPKPDPATIKAETDQKKAEMDMQRDTQKHEMDMAGQQQDLQFKKQSGQLDLAVQERKAAIDLQHKAAQNALAEQARNGQIN